MAISSSGIGSGLDVNGLVSQLVAAERAPTEQRFTRVETTTKGQISAFGALKSALAGLESALKKFEGEGALPGRKAGVGTDAGFSATAGTTARLGSYSISVERLASAHKLQSAPSASTTQVGHGRLSIQVGTGAAVDVDIVAAKGTLADIRDAINTAFAGKDMSATLVRGDAGDVLTLTSSKTGTAGALTITASGGDGGLSSLSTSGGSLTVVTAAQDSRVVIDGITRTSSTNTLTDAIDGITLNLATAKPGQAFSLDIAGDPSPLKASLLTFVSSYNIALTQLRTQSAAGGEGKVAGALSGDSAPRSITRSLRDTITADYATFAALGFKTAVDGSLSLDGAKFDTAIAADPEAASKLLGATGTVGTRLRGSLTAYLGDQGLIGARSTALNDRMKALTRQREAFDVRMESVEQNYRRQFTALDALMAKLQTTSSYLNQQIASLPSASQS